MMIRSLISKIFGLPKGESNETRNPAEVQSADISEDPDFTGIQRLDYKDGGWSETPYLQGKHHGSQIFYHSNGNKKWERKFENDVQTGVEQFWNEEGELIKEVSYKFGEFHGLQRERQSDAAGWDEKSFEFGRLSGFLQKARNPEFAKLLSPHYNEKNITDSDEASQLLNSMGLPTCALKKDKSTSLVPASEKSMWGHVNIMGENENWPERNGTPLSPILQINCAEIPEFNHKLKQFSYLTLFAEQDGDFNTIDDLFVLRTYGHDEKVIEIDPPDTKIITTPALLKFETPFTSFPDQNDLPPNLMAFHRQNSVPLPDHDDDLSSRVGGWPTWLQFTTIEEFGSFLFQIDIIDLEYWAIGDSSLIYFFSGPEDGEYQSHSDML